MSTALEALGAADTLPKLIRSCAAAYGDEIAIELKGEAGPADTITFADLERRSAELARGLIARGAGKGTRIGFIFGNGPAFAEILAAIARIGAVAIPLSTLLRSEELVRVLRQSDIGGLIVQRVLLGHDLVARLCDALPELARADGGPELRIARAPYLRWIVSSGEGLPPAIQEMAFLTGAAASVDPLLLEEIESGVHPTDQMVEIYTSGSMAQPKGVRHLHGPALHRVHYMARMTERKRGAAATVPLPMFWVGGLGLGLLVNLRAGARSICAEGAATNSRAARGSVMGAEELKARAQDRPFWSLGMTETFGPYSFGEALRAPGHPLAPPLDHIAEGFEVRVADHDDRPVEDGQTGEIQVRGYALTPGLHKFERAEHFTADGYYRTGDLGLRDGGRIHFLGRDGDMIKTAKANVSPAEVEMELQTIEGVQSAFVVGLPDPERGQIVAAALVAEPGVKLDAAQIEATLRQRLSSYKVPRAYVEIAGHEVPMLPSNKIAKRELLALVTQRLDRS